MKRLLIVLFLLLASVQVVGAGSSDMSIADIFAKMGNGERLSPGEQNQLAMWVADMENVRGYVAGLSSGTSDINANEIRGHRASFDNDTFVALWASSVSGGYISWDSDYVVIPPVGYFEFDASDPTKLFLTPQTIALFEATRFRFLLTGYAASTTVVGKTVEMEFYNSSDVKIDSQTLIAAVDAATLIKSFAYAFPTVDTDLTATSYIKFAYSGGTLLGTEIYILMV